METYNIALDVEGVLSDTHKATAERSDMLEPKHCPPKNWDFPTEEHHEEFMHVSQNLWHNHNHLIPPTEDGLGKATSILNEVHNVDVVTHRTGVDNQIREWLRGYGIVYDDFISTRKSKSDIGDYDIHIDDSPNVVDDVAGNGRVVYMVERPYNSEKELPKGALRVRGVNDAVWLLTRSL